MKGVRGNRRPLNGHALRALRVSTGRTQTRLAEEAEMDHTHLSRLERGTRRFVTPDQLDRLAAVFGVPCAALIATPEEQNGPLGEAASAHDFAEVAEEAARQLQSAEQWRKEAVEFKEAMQTWRDRALRAEKALRRIQAALPAVDGERS